MVFIYERDRAQRDNMVGAHDHGVLSTRFIAQECHQGMMHPVGGVDEIEGLKGSVVCLVRETLEEAWHVEEPHRRSFHHIEAEGRDEGKVGSEVELFHEFSLLDGVFHAPEAGDWACHILADEVSSCEQDDAVEGDEYEIFWAFAILRRARPGFRR